MFRLFSSRKNTRLLSDARDYLERIFKEEAPDEPEKADRTDAEFRFDLVDDGNKKTGPDEPQNKIRYSLSGIVEDKTDRERNEYIRRLVTELDDMERETPNDVDRQRKGQLDDLLQQSFVDKLIETIDRKGIRDAVVYKAAQIDRRLFSKIVSDRNYSPSKDTCLALCLALKLKLSEANDMLSRAGYSLSHSVKRDVVLEFFFREGIYDVRKVNDVLYRLGLKRLGRETS